MGRLVYISNITLDGYVSDRAGNFNFTTMTPEVFSSILELLRPAKTYVYGRRMYQVMSPWETAHLSPDSPSFIPGLGELERDFADTWRAANKLVISTTLTAAHTQRTRIASALDPDAIRALLRDGDVTVGGAQLAGAMMAADLVDDFHAFLNPTSVGGGHPWLPLDLRLPLELVAARQLGSVVHLHCARSARG